MRKNESKPWLAKWKVLGPVGEGGQGLAEFCVPLASGDESHRCVLKRLKREKDPERRARMHREVSALRTLSHVGLPSYVDGNTEQFDVPKIVLYFVMEHIPGSTLETVVRREPLSLRSAIDLTIALIDIVDHCHSKDVIHRDIKPDNIVLRNDDVANPVLVDFGLTFNRDDPGEHQTDEAQHLGNRFLYLPELRGGAQEKRDARSDLTACCGILYYALTGVPPTSIEDSNGAKPHQRTTVNHVWATIPKPVMSELNNVFDHAFQTPIDRRWQSADALRQALRRVTTAEALPWIGDPMDRLARIRADVQSQPEREHELKVHEVLRAINIELMKAQQAVLSALGNDFTYTRGGYGLEVSQGVLRNTLGIVRANNTAEGVKPRFEACVTGTEIVVTAANDGERSELLRTPLEDLLPVDELQRSTVAYFTSELERALV